VIPATALRPLAGIRVRGSQPQRAFQRQPERPAEMAEQLFLADDESLGEQSPGFVAGGGETGLPLKMPFMQLPQRAARWCYA